MSQPVWKVLYATDVDRVLVDETGVYSPELERAEEVSDAPEASRWLVFRVSLDMTPRYAPATTVCKAQTVLVLRYIVHPGTAIPKGAPVQIPEGWPTSSVVLEMQTRNGSRFRPFVKAWIDSELRMVVQGFDARDEVLRSWEVCSEA